MINPPAQSTTKLSDQNLPPLYEASNRAAITAQRRYMFALKLDLCLLVVTAILFSYNFPDSQKDIITAVYYLRAVFMGISLIITSWLQKEHPERRWRECRWIAEQAKSLAWRYAARAVPFPADLAEADADEAFASQLHALLENGEHHDVLLGGHASGKPITAWMRELRDSTTDVRCATYAQDRLADQQSWYDRKAAENVKFESRWSTLTLITQGAALAYAVAMCTSYLVLNPFNATGFFVTLTATMLAWTQGCQYEQLARVYGKGAHGLGLLAIRERHTRTDEQLSRWVDDVERSISAESGDWYAREGTV